MQTITVTTTRYSATSERTSQIVSHLETTGAGTADQVAEMMFAIMDQGQDISIQGNEIKVCEPYGGTTYYVYTVTEDS